MNDRLDMDDVFAPPEVEKAFVTEGKRRRGDAATIRQAHAKREGVIRAIGWLTIIVGGFYVLMFLIALVAMGQGPGRGGMMMGILMVMGLIGTIILVSGLLLRSLLIAGRILVSIFLGLSIAVNLYNTANSAANPGAMMINVPGLLLCVAFLLPLWTQPSSRIFRADYRLRIIPASRHVKVRLPWWFWVIISFLAIGIGLLIMNMAGLRNVR